MGLKSLFSALVLIFITNSALALTEGVQKLVEFETEANAASQRSSKAMKLPHVEIPLELVGVDFARRLDPLVAQSLVFQRNGQKYVRWILNPEDTKWGKEVLKHFLEKGIVLQIQYYFTGYQTASRSYIAEDPQTGAQFSVKSSTNVTGGAWRDKKQPVGEAVDGRMMSDFFYDQNKKRPFESFVIMDEPVIFKIDAIDQAVVIRDLGELKNPANKKFYLPGFSALHEQVGREIAMKNGSSDPLTFWTENYVKVAGRALGELAARTGVQFDSPHSQNFLVELDSNMKPTGRLVLRDMSDLYLDASFINALLGEKNTLLSKFDQKDNLHLGIDAGFGPLHGNSSPSWISDSQYRKWNRVFATSFEESFKNISGFDLARTKATWTQNGAYFGAEYRLDTNKDFSTLFRMMKNEGVVKNYGGKMSCSYVLHGA